MLFEQSHLSTIWMVFGWLPLIYVAIFVFRFLEIALFSPLLKLMGAELKWSEMTFISLAGLRGALALILAQTLLQYEMSSDGKSDVKEKVGQDCLQQHPMLQIKVDLRIFVWSWAQNDIPIHFCRHDC